MKPRQTRWSWGALAIAGLCFLAAGELAAQCPYSSVQSRVQLNEANPWQQSLSVGPGQSFRVGAFKNGWGVFVDPGTTTISVTAPSGTVTYPANGSYVTASQAGVYTVRATCGSLSDTATVSSVGTAYDMFDYMRHDNTNKAILLTTNDGQTQVIRSYTVTGDRFYITKNWDGSGATDYEEYMYDSSYIYLVRDTSWQAANWCGSAPTSFELWTGLRNRGARFPRYVTNGSTHTPPASIIKARKEGNGCALCDSPVDSDGQYVATTYRFDYLASKTFSTGQTVTNVMKITITGGAGSGETYYYAKALGFVGYEDPYQWSYYSGVANGGADFPVVAKDACPGASGCTWYQSRAANVYHQTGEPDALDWSANTTEHSAGYLSYGPYDPKWCVGRHYAHWYLQIDNRSADNAVVATVDAVTDQGRRVLARRDIRRQEFTATYSWQWFTLAFDYPSFEQVEVRIYWHDNAYIKHGGTYICK